MAKSKEIESYIDFYLDEMNSATMYAALAEIESSPNLAEVYRRLASTEREHARNWAQKLKEAGGEAPQFSPTWRTRTLIWLAKRLGPEVVLPSMIAMENNGTQDYATADSAGGKMASSEHSHAMLLGQISRSVHGGLEGSAVARLEGRHRSVGGNALRAAVRWPGLDLYVDHGCCRSRHPASRNSANGLCRSAGRRYFDGPG
jgi:hypothetical protein